VPCRRAPNSPHLHHSSGSQGQAGHSPHVRIRCLSFPVLPRHHRCRAHFFSTCQTKIISARNLTAAPDPKSSCLTSTCLLPAPLSPLFASKTRWFCALRFGTFLQDAFAVTNLTFWSVVQLHISNVQPERRSRPSGNPRLPTGLSNQSLHQAREYPREQDHGQGHRQHQCHFSTSHPTLMPHPPFFRHSSFRRFPSAASLDNQAPIVPTQPRPPAQAPQTLSLPTQLLQNYPLTPFCLQKASF